MSKAKQNTSEFAIISNFNSGYRNREDVTKLPPGVLIKGSQNVLTDVSGRVGITKGYSLDGASSAVLAPILSSFDWQMHTGEIRHLRAGFLTDAGNDGKLQYRYVDAAGAVTWRDLMTSLTSVNFNFTDYWNNTAFQAYLLFVNGLSNIYEWSGGVTTFASATNNSGVITALNATPTAAGSSYVVGDVLTITTGGTGATCRVNATTGGVVTSVSLLTAGSGYTTGTGKATSGGTGTGCTVNITSIGTGTITKQGTESWAEIGFYATAGSVTINGVDYAYTSGGDTTTLTGISPSPASAGAVGDVIHQTPKTTANSTMTAIPSTFANSLIANLKNQIYIASLVSNQMYVSKVNDYTNYTFTAPVRVVGEGAILTLDGTPVALIPQEDQMYISAGADQWYVTEFVLSSDLSKETLSVNRLKTTAQQATQSQALTSKIGNNVVFVSNEPIVSSLGRVDNVVLTPQISDISYPIINDMVNYDFTDGSVFYWRNYVLVAIPQSSVIRIYNMTNKQKDENGNKIEYWEAPLMIAVSRFSIIDGELYGHSYLTSESYELFTGYNFNNHPIDARAIFSYMNSGDAADSKSFDEFFAEGYISTNATILEKLNYELDGYSGSQEYPIVGTDTQIVQIPTSNSPLGKKPLGKSPLGGDLNAGSGMPSKFRVIKTMIRTPYYEFSPSFTSVGVDYNWSILRFGPQATLTSEGNNSIKV